ncbi:outer membrane beta-barrel protein [Chitinophaga sp. 30R24]|uniref:outer membrane beta-barrel protein n=1 Tax=Chitinophaga sp. 30R24 TaxID=3248838 RepID=UPI003B912E6F
MKFFTLLFPTFFVVVISCAQASLGIRAGFASAGLGSSGGNAISPNARLDNWQAGAYADVPLFTSGYIQIGVNYLVKGAELDHPLTHPLNLFTSGASKLKLQYLELPVNFVYKQPVSFGKLIIGAGPYGAYCTRADYKLSIFNDGRLIQSSSQHLDFDSSPNVLGTDMSLQRWDAGINFIAGLELKSFLTLDFHYSQGLLDMNKLSNNKLKNNYWGITLGFLFDREDW